MTATAAQQFHEKIKDVTQTPLEETPRFPQAAHLWSESERNAITLALAAGRPLLIRGEAGSGKSQLARAAAAAMDAELLVEVIHARFEASDIKYRLDLIKRLADAEVGDSESRARVADWANYIDKGIYWHACQYSHAKQAVVMLIDEIDKADADIPNALLDVLANGSFECTESDELLSIERNNPPLIIITTNEDRELPAAFVRRCVVLNQNPPDNGQNQASFCPWLQARGQAHGYLRIKAKVAEEAAVMVWHDREYAVNEGFPPVGLAEYIDLLRALDNLAANNLNAQRQWLDKLRGYALIKQRDLDQQRHQQNSSASGSDQ